MVVTTGEQKETSSCSLLFTRRSRRVSGLEALSLARVRCVMVLRRGDEEIARLGLRRRGRIFCKKLWEEVMIVRRSQNVN